MHRAVAPCMRCVRTYKQPLRSCGGAGGRRWSLKAMLCRLHFAVIIVAAAVAPAAVVGAQGQAAGQAHHHQQPERCGRFPEECGSVLLRTGLAALLRALEVSPLPPTAAAGGGWRSSVRTLASELMVSNRLQLLLAEPVIAAALGRHLAGMRCESTDLEQREAPSDDSSVSLRSARLSELGEPNIKPQLLEAALQLALGLDIEASAQDQQWRRRLGETGNENGTSDGTAVLMAFVAPANRSSWALSLTGWGAGTDPCKPYPKGWSGVFCGSLCPYVGATGRVCTLSFQNGEWDNPNLRFMIGPAIKQLRDHLTWLDFTKTQLYGTMPNELGELHKLKYMDLSFTSLSGTVPEALCGLMALQSLHLELTLISGTLPRAVGGLTQLQDLQLFDTSLSGTLSQTVGGMVALQLLYLSSTSISGTIPHTVGELTQMRNLHLYYTSVSGTLPETIGEMMQMQTLYLQTTSLSGTLPEVLGELKQLFHLDMGSTLLSGTLPDLSGCDTLDKLELSSCALTGLPPALPSGLGHLYLDNNPINATPAALGQLLAATEGLDVADVGFMRLPIPLVRNPRSTFCERIPQPSGCQKQPGSFGTRVATPRGCFVGQNNQCAFRLDMYDSTNSPVHIGHAVRGLQLGLGGKRIPMVDLGNGSLLARINMNWIERAGPKIFNFYDGEGREFTPFMTAAGTLANGVNCSTFRGHEGEGGCPSLRTVVFQPRRCPFGSHTIADAATGSRCVCDRKGGFTVPYSSNISGSSLACHVPCFGESFPSHDGASCVCTGTAYNVSATGVLLCIASHVRDPSTLMKAHAISSECHSCPVTCATCNNGIATLREGWRLNAPTDDELVKKITQADAARPQLAFLCPFGSSYGGVGDTGADCPSLQLSSNAGAVSCRDNHTGILCAICLPGFSRKGSSDNSCQPCTVNEPLGESVIFFALAGSFTVSLLMLLWVVRRQVQHLKAEIATNLRILLGAGQVLSLLSGVLDLVYPRHARTGFSFASFASVDVGSVFSFDCHGYNWYERWTLLVGVLPLAMLLLIGARWLWKRCQHGDDGDIQAHASAVALNQARGNLQFVVMLLYPQLSTRILGALHCRQLGPRMSVLVVDYSVSCESDNARYGHYRVMAIVLVCVWVVGIPLALLALLLRQWHKSKRRWLVTDIIGSNDGTGEDGDIIDAADSSLSVFNYSRVRKSFGFCVDDFKPECFWFEPLDMLRKLALSGLLQFVQPGTGAQVFFGCVIAFVSFGTQVYWRPFREPEANTLKALVDAQIFLTFLVSFILRVLGNEKVKGAEPLSASFYGWVLLSSMVALLLTGMGLTGSQIRRRHKFRGSLMDLATSTGSFGMVELSGGGGSGAHGGAARL